MLNIGKKKYRNLQEQVGYNTKEIEKLFSILDGIDYEDHVVVIQDISIPLTEEEMLIVAEPVSFLVYNDKLYFKDSSDEDKLYFSAVIEIQGTEILSLKSHQISVAILNGVMQIINTTSDTYSKAKIDEIASSLATRISSLAGGSPKGVYATLADLQSAYPTGAEGIYVVSADGHWYYWNGSAWADGGTYQATEIASHSVGFKEINENVLNRFLYTKTIASGTMDIRFSIKNSIGDTLSIIPNISPKITSGNNYYVLYGRSGGTDYTVTGGYGNQEKSVVLTRQYDSFNLYFSGSASETTTLELQVANLSLKGNLTTEVFKTQKDVNSLLPLLSKLPPYVAYDRTGINQASGQISFQISQSYLNKIGFENGDSLYFFIDTNISFNSATLYGYVGSDSYSLWSFANTSPSYFMHRIFVTNRAYTRFEFYFTLASAAANAYMKVYCVNLSKDNLVSRLFRIKQQPKTRSTRLLVIGDSYSAGEQYLKGLGDLVNISVRSVGVVSATLKDRYQDRETYPYTNNPVSTDNSGNHNTFACQVEKIKSNMSTWYPTEDTYPDVILIQGGNNDNADGSTEEYINEIYSITNAYYTSHGGSTQQGSIAVPVSHEDTNRTNFCGAMKYLKGELHALFPNAVVIFITNSRLMFATNYYHKEYLEKSEQMKYAASLLGSPIVDWASEGTFTFSDYVMTGDGTQGNPYNITTQSEYTNDSLHPNFKGGALMAKSVAKMLVGLGLADYIS